MKTPFPLGLAFLISLSALSAADRPILTFEAEAVTGPHGAWTANRSTPDHWNLWSNDADAAKKWSGGVVLQSPPVLVDRASPEAGAPPLHTHITGIPAGRYEVTLKMFRTLGVSRDGGKNWERLSNGDLGEVVITDGTFDLWVDDRFADPTNPGPGYYDNLQFTPILPVAAKPRVEGFARERVRERLDRGLVALRRSATEVRLSWRLLVTDEADTAFHVLRTDAAGHQQRITAKPITTTSDFTDKAALPGASSYAVLAVSKGVEGSASPPAAVLAGDQPQSFLSIALEPGTTVQKVGIGDLDGDGRYDYVLKTPRDSIDPYVSFWTKSPDTYHLEARSSDGRLLWNKDLGWSIERGIWYSPFIVFDLDGDGKAEVIAKTGEGDPRDVDGRVQSGPEWATVFEGATGRELARVPWPASTVGGETLEYNYANRNQITVAYLDGKTPCLILERGTYTTIQVHAYQFYGGKLTPVWKWTSLEERQPKRWRGQGAHTLQAHDVDGDGRDEVVIGSAVIDDNGVGLWSTGLGHPDHCYVGKIMPDRPGLQIFYGMETAQPQANGLCIVDAATGKIIWGLDGPTRHVHGTGFCADVDAAHPGLEVYGCDTDLTKRFERGWLLDAHGGVVTKTNQLVEQRPVYWDADVQKELIARRRITKYGSTEVQQEIAGTVVLVADVWGDWREEVFTSLPGELRIYTTPIPATDRRACLMQDPVYRNTVAAAAQGYLYNPMLSYLPAKK
ncbi:MAG: silent information regulator protein Sir2 [Undibacterium sp.]|nr:silent information regulator protein Sir2 [Opitutaceae bacterium]